jgi:peroxiredoxin
MDPAKKTFGKIINYLVIVLLTVVVVLLSLQNRELKGTIRNLTMPIQPIDPLKSGERVEPFDIKTLDGSSGVVRFTDPTKKHLLFVFSTTCPHCARTLPFWQMIAESRTKDVDVLGVSIHDVDLTNKYVAESNVNFYVVSVDTNFSRKYRVSGVPETILINGDGKVEQAWIGELSSNQMNEIQNLLSASETLSN